MFGGYFYDQALVSDIKRSSCCHPLNEEDVKFQMDIVSQISWEFDVPVMENFIPASMVWDAIASKHD